MKMKIETTADGEYLTKHVIGFSGYRTQKPREQIYTPGELTRLRYPGCCVIIYHNPVVKGYHLPQDAVGVHFKDDQLMWGLADGVSIVGGTTDNQSGVLAHKLVSQLHALDEDWKTKLAQHSRSFLKSAGTEPPTLSAASTLVWGNIYKDNNQLRLKILVLGAPSNLGMLNLYTPKGWTSLQGDSHGFVPGDYKPDLQELVLPRHFSLVSSTDGALIEKRALEELLQTKFQKIPLDELTEYLTGIIYPQKDDQSLLIINRTG